MKSNIEIAASSPLGTASYPQITATVSAVKSDHRSMGSPKRKNDSIKNLGECTSGFIRLLELTPTVFKGTN